jgi:diguanylate cyclase (GGDEF)-like protein
MMAVSYNAWLVVLSIALATFDAYVALSVIGRVVRSHGRARALWIGFGALAMGLGVWAMHFVGMLAYRLATPLGFDVGLTALSVLPAMLATGAALWMVARRDIRAANVWLPGCTLGIGIGGMHYLGMHAVRMQPAIIWNEPLVAASLLVGMAGASVVLWANSLIWRRYRARRQLLRVLVAGLMGGTMAGVHHLGMAAAGMVAGAVSLSASSGLHGLGLGLVVSTVSGLLLLLTLGVSLVQRQLERHADAINRELGAARDALTHQAFHDALTQLPNRANVLNLLQQLLPRARREQFEVAVMFVDLDGFKSINDTLGHEAGDQFLRSVADALRASVRERDTVARFGGDEFVIVLERYRNEANLVAICEKILALVGRPVAVGGHSVSATPSIGVAVFPRDGEDAASLLRHADIAMYTTKEQGKAGYRFYQQCMSDNARERLLLSAQLRDALRRDEIFVHYQPKVDLDGYRLVGLEALARWIHPERGLMSPDSFVPLAEQSGLIGRLGERVLQQVARQIAQWSAAGLPLVPVAVNVSLQEIQGNHFIDILRLTMADFGLAPGAIELEITETVAMMDAGRTLQKLRQLEALGFHLTIDDFGTGFSNLNHLRQLPLQSIKIDQSFVQGASLNQADRDITEAIVALAHKLRLQVIAEGIETPGQADWLQLIGCKVGQGFLFMRPVDAAAVPALLRQGHVRPQEAVA